MKQKKPRRPAKWSRLDNAAKIFPPTSTKRDTKVFRFACELNEPVDAAILQKALDKAVAEFPLYRCILKKGLFWYYLEESGLLPEVREESAPLCAPLYDKNVRQLLFNVTYYHNRINLEIYHSLADGTGALQFLQTLVYHYLLLKHGEDIGDVPPMGYDASFSQKADDSFQKYYRRNTKSIQKNKLRAYHLRGVRVPEYRIKLIEGEVPVRAVVDKAHEYGATLTTFLISVLMCSFAEVMNLRERKRPVVVTVPVNLRKYFPSETARNFFSVFEVGYCFSEDKPNLEKVVQYVTEYFEHELTAERMGIRMNKLAALEHNLAARAVPRPIKDFVLRIANYASDRGITAAVSNIGRTEMPEPMKSYIRLFDVFVSTDRLQICMCSFEEILTLSITSAFESSEVEKNFFRTLSGMGIPVTIVTTPEEGEPS